MPSTDSGATIELDRDSPVPLWAQLRHDLSERAARGEFADAFPSEMALVASYGVSRNTVRESLRHLRAEGVVIAGRGRRPRLRAEIEIAQPLGALYSLYDSVESAGHDQTSVVRELHLRRDANAASRLGLSASTRLLYLERLRLADGEPLAIDRAWFPADIAEPLVSADFTHTGFYDELASRTGIHLTGGHEQFRAVVPSSRERAILGLGSGVAAFAIERTGRVSDRIVEWRQTLVRGDRFTLVAEFSAGPGSRLDVSARVALHAPAPSPT